MAARPLGARKSRGNCHAGGAERQASGQLPNDHHAKGQRGVTFALRLLGGKSGPGQASAGQIELCPQVDAAVVAPPGSASIASSA